MKVVTIAVLLTCLGIGAAAIARNATPAAPSASKKAPPALPAQARPALAPGAAPGTAAMPPSPPLPTDPDAGEVGVPDGALDTALPPPSSAAQQLYASAKADLLQIRMLLKNGRSQSSVGSGFMVGTSQLVLTNYHVVSQMAINPDVYVGEYVDTDGKSGPIELLAVDVLHDLAVVRINRNGTGFFNVPERAVKLTQGQYLYSLGNPLDLGFAISEGAYNGIVARSFYDHLMFTGPINSGMSGGPSVTSDGTVAGVNVSKRTDGESVSFLVPVKYAQELLLKVQNQKVAPKDFNPLIGQQLLEHQRRMIDRLLDGPLKLKRMGPYVVPVRESDQVRCWGRSNVKARATFNADTMACAMESAIYVSESQLTGHVSITHQYVRSHSLDAVRFGALASALFKTDKLGSDKNGHLSAPRCTEKFVRTKTLPLRAVTCVRAYHKFAGLYNFTLLTASTDDRYASLQSRLDVAGVSFDNGQRAVHAFLSALGHGGRQ